MRKTPGIFVLMMAAVIAACEDILEIPDISNQTVEILAPLNETVLSDSVVTVSWNDVTDAEGYTVQIATPNFENAAQILLDSTMILDSTFVGTHVTQVLGNGDFEWRVQAFNLNYSTTFSQATFSVVAP